MKSLLISINLVFILFLSSPLYAYETTGYKWESQTPGSGASISWGYASEGSACRIGSDSCGGGLGVVSDISSSIIPGGFTEFDNTIRSAFQAWSDVADLVFSFTFDSGADILIGGHSIDGSNRVVAHAFTSFNIFPSPELDLVVLSDIHFDTDNTFGTNIFNIIAHEIGHSLGLAHVDDPNSLMNPFISRNFIGPQVDDIAGIQFLYGPAVTAVPIPSGFWLLLSAFSALSLLPKRRSKFRSSAIVQL